MSARPLLMVGGGPAGMNAAIAAAATLERSRGPIEGELRRVAPIRLALDRVSELRPGLASLAEDDTIVCRCEEIPWRDVRGAAGAGCATYRGVKVAARVGMGACQGRFCWPSASRLVARELGGSPEDIGPGSARPPVRPVTLGEPADAGAEVG